MIAAVRVRGTPDVRRPVKEELGNLGLDSVNSSVILPESEGTSGRLERVGEFVTWGELSEEGAEALVGRAKVSNRKSLTEDRVEEITGYPSREDLAEALASGDTDLQEAGLRKSVGLHPPRKGYKNTRRRYPEGSLGYRGDEINDLLRRMR